MNDEIKEILEQLEWYKKIGKKDVYYPECVLPNKKAFILLNYITNLQQENERIEKEYKSKVDDIGKLISRIYKAIEYIKEHIRIDDEYPDYMEMLIEERDNLLNILQNGSEENE